ncbi:hypothetical protein ACFPYJ_12345 [Paenibacillus solisilvae]|uniref:Sensor histidine kinase n=1 Tax=Paenibacillus solisilvae TaxID=2486751 RepID=A0ABW0VVN3_9BACL
MIFFKIFLSRFLMLLFTSLFICPAIIFSVLVLGLTSSWKSGAFMLGTALLLQLTVKLYSINLLIHRNKERERRFTLESLGNNEVPPPLSEIYLELLSQQREQELIVGKIVDQGTDTSPKQ